MEKNLDSKDAPDSSGDKKGKGMIRSIISKSLLLLTVLVTGVGLIFLVLFIERSALPYNSEGNYFDGTVNYHQHSVTVYGVLAGASFSGAMILCAVRLLLRRRPQAALAKRHASAEPPA
jgi:hypothetical protein